MWLSVLRVKAGRHLRPSAPREDHSVVDGEIKNMLVVSTDPQKLQLILKVLPVNAELWPYVEGWRKWYAC
jgi:hypothetical protein